MTVVDQFLWFSGLVVWVLVGLYVVPLLPILIFAWMNHLTLRVEKWWGDQYLPQDRPERTEQYKELRDEGDWRTKASAALSSIARLYRNAQDRYERRVEPLYSRLPGV